MISTYAQLLTELSAYLKRDDFTARYSTFVQLAEARFNRILRTVEMEDTEDLAVTAGDPLVTLPTDFLQLRDIMIVDGSDFCDLEVVAPSIISRVNSSDRATPRYVAIMDGSFKLAPVPVADTTLRIVYFQKIPALETATENWLLTKAPDVYLFGALLEAEPYLVNDARLPLWKSRLDEALAELQRSSEGMRFGSSPLVMRGVTSV